MGAETKILVNVKRLVSDTVAVYAVTLEDARRLAGRRRGVVEVGDAFYYDEHPGCVCPHGDLDCESCS